MRSTSGDVKLQMAPSSSFEVRYDTHSGDLNDGLKMQTIQSAPSKHGSGTSRSRYGKGEGCIEVQTFSGDLQLIKH
jgi:DUF4097 and DUF4098 domain-containing protein YvlB